MAEEKTITSFNLDSLRMSAAGGFNSYNIKGGSGATFNLEVKNSAGKYYNFKTKTFQTAVTRLDQEMIGSNGSYNGSILFPKVSSNDQYDFYLFANAGSKHASRIEVRREDNSIDLNTSSGSNSMLLQKVVYQDVDMVLTLSPYSPNSVTDIIKASTRVDYEITIPMGGSVSKTPFTISCETNATTKSYRIRKQPSSSDILSFIEPTIGAAPITLPEENIYPTVTATGNTNAVMSSTVTVTMVGTIEDLGLKIGDKVIQATGPFFANIVTVVAISGGGLNAYQFTASEAVSVGSGVRLNFYNQMNYSWPINNYANLIKDRMLVLGDNILSNTAVGNYKDEITINENTKAEYKIVNSAKRFIDTKGQIPTITRGLTTTQAGNIIFNKQQVLALAGDTLKLGGYGTGRIYDIYGYKVKFSDLKIAFTPITTTTTEATAAHATIAVADREGVINNVSRVSGIGIDPSVQDPLITSGGGADGAGDWVMGAVQTLENGITLTVENTGREAIITGNIQVLETGTANQTLRFDVERLLSIT